MRNQVERAEWSPIVVARVDDVVPGDTRKFRITCHNREIEAFLVNYRGSLHAYVNRCCHVPMTMDWIDNQFLTEDGAYIQCATHGACYVPDTGECIAGPPLGQCLTAVPLRIQDGLVLAECPHDD